MEEGKERDPSKFVLCLGIFNFDSRAARVGDDEKGNTISRVSKEETKLENCKYC